MRAGLDQPRKYPLILPEIPSLDILNESEMLEEVLVQLLNILERDTDEQLSPHTRSTLSCSQSEIQM